MVGMDELRIEDNDADAFVLRDGGEVLLEMDGDGTAVEISDSDAARIVDWLRERFGILTDPGSAFGQSVTITVPGVSGGAPREVSWMGDGDAPEWLTFLAGTALGATPQANTVAREQYATLREVNERNYAGWRELITALGASTPEGALATAKHLRDPENWRAVLEVLGAENPKDAAGIAQTWRTWLDEAGRILIRAGVADVTAQTPIDPVKALNTLLNRHAAKLKTQTEHWAERERQIRAESLSATESAVAREREARAQVQTSLELARNEARVSDAKHRDALRLNEDLRATIAAERVELAKVRGELREARGA